MPILFSDDAHERLERNVALVIDVMPDGGLCFYMRPFHVQAGYFSAALAEYDGRLAAKANVWDAIYVEQGGDTARVFLAIRNIVEAATEEGESVPFVLQGNRAICSLYNVHTQLLSDEPAIGQIVRGFWWPMSKAITHPKTHKAILAFVDRVVSHQQHIADYLDFVVGLPPVRDHVFGRRGMQFPTSTP